MGILGTLQVALIVLKVLGLINERWIVILIPLFTSLVIFVVIATIAVIIELIERHKDNKMLKNI